MKMIRDKRGVQFQAAIFALVAISIIVYGIGIWVGQWNTDYNSGLTYDLNNYSKLDTLSTYASGSQGDIAVKSSSDPSGLDFEGTSLRGAFKIINNIFAPFNVVFGRGGLINSIQDRWGIPDYIVIGFVTMFIIAIIFTIIALFFKKPTPA